MAADPLFEQLAAACAGRVVAAASLAALTTMKVGGPARVLVEAESEADLTAVGRASAEHGVGCLVVGRGSNLLIADRGWPGIAVRLGRRFRGVTVDGTTVTAGGAVALPVLATSLAEAGLSGLVFAVAVPGSVGGGVRMNAGAHGGEVRQVLVEAQVVRLRTGVAETWPTDALGMRYRRTDLPDDGVVVNATFSLEPADRAEIVRELADVRAWRRANQPVNDPSCGSVFTNPEGDSAGRLVESSGGKGLRVGGARISERHANFIVTQPGATAADVRTLIGRVRQLVAETHGVELVPEVVMVGDFEDGPAWT